MNRVPTVVIAGLVCLAAASAVSHAQQTRRYIAPRTAADAGQPPFSGAVQVGKTLYLSGDIGLDANNRVPDTAEAACCSRTCSGR